ncbi:cupredoxin domain-containing protein [Bacillus sp. FJAT-29790]|uniref:cupredoxin domain-containing protein n=1 Tax=Bacillus sp. FJAT-29790 TaxID=1895002 RepID=UPI001C243726|nr:cupredoxin domain-containing protein [Bacillus sp. FJAT-29790]MBU8878357.1 cupredoxin domain-containing protein [Bacillus sp. FJAT-29790]
MQFFVIKKRAIIMFLVIFTVIASASVWLYVNAGTVTAFSQEKTGKIREIDMVTGEFKSKISKGKEIEAYVFHPGTIVLEKGEKVHLKIHGVNGEEHPFYIEGTDIEGVVKKGEVTLVPLQFKKEGTYRLICKVHPGHHDTVPMIAYIVVD